MSRATQKQGFSAHGGMRDIPRGAVPLQKQQEQAQEQAATAATASTDASATVTENA